MDAIILTRTSHLDHIHNVLGVRVFLLPQIQHFEFLPHRRVVTLSLNGPERAQRLLGTAVFFRVREALVHFNLSKSFLFLESKFDVIQRFVRKSNQVWGDRQRKLSEIDLPVRLVTKSPQYGIDVFFEDFLLELKEVILDVLEVQKAEIARVNHAEHRNCIELVHCLKRLLLYFDLDMVVNLFFKEP